MLANGVFERALTAIGMRLAAVAPPPEPPAAPPTEAAEASRTEEPAVQLDPAKWDGWD